MKIDKILAISGKPGLYELKLQTRTGFVAESLLDGKKVTVGMRSNVSLLSEISMYSHSGEKPLAEVMRAIAVKENEGPAPSHKEDASVLTAYFAEIFPDYDQDRVYTSDIKKVFNWYNLLQAKGLVSKEAPQQAGQEDQQTEAAPVAEAPEKQTEAPAKTKKPKANKEA